MLPANSMTAKQMWLCTWRSQKKNCFLMHPPAVTFTTIAVLSGCNEAKTCWNSLNIWTLRPQNSRCTCWLPCLQHQHSNTYIVSTSTTCGFILKLDTPNPWFIISFQWKMVVSPMFIRYKRPMLPSCRNPVATLRQCWLNGTSRTSWEYQVITMPAYCSVWYVHIFSSFDPSAD